MLSDQDELFQQSRRVIIKATGIIPAPDKAKERASLAAPIVVGSAQTLTRNAGNSFPRLERYPRDHFRYIISDELHRGTDRAQKVWDYFETAQVCGVTATPFRAHLADLSKWVESMVYQMGIMDFVEQGFAPPPKILTLPVEINMEDLKVKRGFDGKEYDLESVDSAITPHYEAIADLLKEHAKDRKLLVYLPLIRSSEAFATILRKVGIRAHHVDGKSPNRDELIEAFSRGEFDCLCNANLLSCGVDIPIADAFLNLRLTSSRSWFQQARGRVLRVLPGVIDHLTEKHQAAERKLCIANSSKRDALLFDLLLQHDKLGSPHVGDDFCSNEHDAQTLFEKSKQLKTPQDLIETSKRVQAEREAALVAALEKAAIKTSLQQGLAAPQVAALINDNSLLDYVPVARWQQAPVSEAQRVALFNFGIDPETVTSKGHASAIMDAIITRKNLGYCTLKQCRILKKYHPEITHPDQITFQTAISLIDQTFKGRRRAAA